MRARVCDRVAEIKAHTSLECWVCVKLRDFEEDVDVRPSFVYRNPGECVRACVRVVGKIDSSIYFPPPCERDRQREKAAVQPAIITE